MDDRVFTTECGCNTYPCDCTGCDCGETFHLPGEHCPGQPTYEEWKQWARTAERERDVARGEVARLRKVHGYVYRPPYRGPNAGSDTGGVWYLPEQEASKPCSACATTMCDPCHECGGSGRESVANT